MTQEQIMTSFDNAWRALAHRYDDDPDESTRLALNLLKDMIYVVQQKIDTEKEEAEQKQKAIELKEWIAWFNDSL